LMMSISSPIMKFSASVKTRPQFGVIDDDDLLMMI
jgi:hypothetical protein